MNCPRCKTTLENTTVEGVEIDTCKSCGGLLLDHGELDRVAAPHEGDLEYSSLDQESFEHSDNQPVTACPRCTDSKMKKVEFNIYTGIILDYCDRCRAFWLDRDELERVNAHVRELDEGPADTTSPTMLWFMHFIWSLPR